MANVSIQDQLCDAFCGALQVHAVPVGLAVSTGFANRDGDSVGFYVIGPDNNNNYWIEDDGLYVPHIEAEGADISGSSKTRSEAFQALMEEYHVEFDEDSRELRSGPISSKDVPSAALRFLAFLLRIQDLILMSTDRVASTFKEDATNKLKELAAGKASFREHDILHEKLSEYPADLIISSSDLTPVALFFGTSDLRILEALLLQAYAEKEKISCYVAAMVEREQAISPKSRQRATNHLDAFTIFRGDERDACAKILKQAFGGQSIH